MQRRRNCPLPDEFPLVMYSNGQLLSSYACVQPLYCTRHIISSCMDFLLVGRVECSIDFCFCLSIHSCRNYADERMLRFVFALATQYFDAYIFRRTLKHTIVLYEIRYFESLIFR